MNITLSADKKTVEKARDYAKKHDSSLNQLVRDFLEQLVNEMDNNSAADEFEYISHEFAGESAPEYSFKRENEYDRNNQEEK